MNPFHVYEPSECGEDGYPFEWHKTVKQLVRAQAGHRCIRCSHPYPLGIRESCPKGEWTPCDEQCVHFTPIRIAVNKRPWTVREQGEIGPQDYRLDRGVEVEARWRILTVHHLRLGHDAKRDLRWWNLCALCQRCHLQIQGKVQMERIWPWPHSDWFKPYAAGWYAHAYLAEDLTRTEVEARMDELLALELVT
jgi:hypothetical protein